jgi:acyl dehydratase
MPRTPVRLAVGDLESSTVGPITQTDIVRFAGAGGDFNPLHHDADYATRSGLPAVISMGQMQAGMLAAWVSDQVCVEHLLNYSVRFVAPVFIGDTLRFTGRVESTSEQSGVAVAEMSLVASCGDRIIMTGRARVRVAAP